MVASARDLPESLVVPLRSGQEWWYWLGGRPAIDFVNTLRERWRRRVETLVTAGDLSLWLVEAGLLDERRRATRALLADARDLREAIDAGLRAAVDGSRTPRAAVGEIDAWLAHAGARPSLALARDGAPVLGARGARDPVAAALATVALDAARMLGTPGERARLRAALVLDDGLRQPGQGAPPSGADHERGDAMSSEVRSGLEGVVAFATT